MNILIIEFIESSTKTHFDLRLISHYSIDSGGIPHQEVYKLVIDDKLVDFWNYVKEKFGVVLTSQKILDLRELCPTEATIIQKTRGVDSNLPWKHKFETTDGNTIELIEFCPFTCELGEDHDS